MMMEEKVYTVHEFNNEVRLLLEKNYQSIWVEGEISNLASPASGHRYFTLKDESAQLRCAFFRQRQLRHSSSIENGIAVLVRGKISLYETRGDFQLIVEHIEPAGEGVLRRRYDELKNKLIAEGLFDSSLKLMTPELPNTIGIITSTSGAAIQDILSTLYRRFPIADVLVYPVSVQGKQATSEIVSALEKANKYPTCDVLILSRGGGSLEDLWPFNEEAVVRAIVDSSIPVVAGIGHETDVTLSDLAADYRAATPTAAAEYVTPDKNDLIDHLASLRYRAQLTIESYFQKQNQNIDLLSRRLRHPLERLRSYQQTLRNLIDRSVFCISGKEHRKEMALLRLSQRLLMLSPVAKIERNRVLFESLTSRLILRKKSLILDPAGLVAAIEGRLQALSPKHTLERGYAILRAQKTGDVISDAKYVNTGEHLTAELAHGQLVCTIDKIDPIN
tara:strand:+ start:648 stop:1988 length:1341 start_codon:yes stop_codon:yes gene_type:complete